MCAIYPHEPEDSASPHKASPYHIRNKLSLRSVGVEVYAGEVKLFALAVAPGRTGMLAFALSVAAPRGKFGPGETALASFKEDVEFLAQERLGPDADNDYNFWKVKYSSRIQFATGWRVDPDSTAESPLSRHH